MNVNLGYDFFDRPATVAARELVGKILVHKTPDGEIKLRISEAEAYLGESDTACHAHHGRTPRTEVLYMAPGTIYVYLCYGIHNLLNIVTGSEGDPQAVLIRACEGAEGPGKLTKFLKVDRNLNRGSAVDGAELWVEDDGYRPEIKALPRVGIGYASPEDQARLWRFSDNT